MTDGYVFDVEPLIAYLYDEPGHEAVAGYLEDVTENGVSGVLAETNAAEVFYLIARFEGDENDKPTPDSLRIADRDLRALERGGIDIVRADWRIAAEIKADGHISLADAHAVALAEKRGYSLIGGGDDDFDELPVDIDVIRFRDGSA
ncbi:PIN domain-containing protein [Natronoglomus mannanivorans]|uniref:PIN domain-containing protein n=1 Tax=Natronoglomus mannanivorans TaxID=2979990 RepID=A0AAP3E3U6_9EURY|nr:PIN domain-containing protein [Halobacteria archaeon AArc-xg1-1]